MTRRFAAHEERRAIVAMEPEPELGGGCGAPPSAADEGEIALESLLRGRRMVVIRYGERRYRLSLTRQDKLILTKDETSEARGPRHGRG